MAKLHIKKGDTVRVIAGESKGAEGTVRKVFTEKSRAIVEGDDIKKMSKHSKPNAANPEGGIVKEEAPIHLSNLMVIDGKGNATKTGRKVDDAGKNVRFSKKSGEVIV